MGMRNEYTGICSHVLGICPNCRIHGGKEAVAHPSQANEDINPDKRV